MTREPCSLRSVTYLLYIIFYESLCIGGGAYVVFWLHRSPLWFVLCLFMSAAAYRPLGWIHGIEEKNDDTSKAD